MLLIDKSIDLKEIKRKKRKMLKEKVESEDLYMLIKKNNYMLYRLEKKFKIATVDNFK